MPSGVAALVIASIPLWVVVLDRVFFGARLSRRAALGVGVGFAGVVLLVDPGGAARSTRPARSCSARRRRGLGVRDAPLARPDADRPAARRRRDADARRRRGARGGRASHGRARRARLGEVTARSLGGFLYLDPLRLAARVQRLRLAARNARTSLVATYAYVNPVVAVTLGWAVLGEAIDARVLVAGGIIVASVALIVSAPAAPARRAPAANPRCELGREARVDRVRHGRLAVGDLGAGGLEQVARLPSELDADDRVVGAVADRHGRQVAVEVGLPASTTGTNPLSATSAAWRGRPVPSPSAWVITAPCEKPPSTVRSGGMPVSSASASSHGAAARSVAWKVGGSG